MLNELNSKAADVETSSERDRQSVLEVDRLSVEVI